MQSCKLKSLEKANKIKVSVANEDVSLVIHIVTEMDCLYLLFQYACCAHDIYPYLCIVRCIQSYPQLTPQNIGHQFLRGSERDIVAIEKRQVLYRNRRLTTPIAFNRSDDLIRYRLPPFLIPAGLYVRRVEYDAAWCVTKLVQIRR